MTSIQTGADMNKLILLKPKIKDTINKQQEANEFLKQQRTSKSYSF